MMVQGHTLHVVLNRTYHDHPAFVTWLFLRGLTAPMFLLLAGVSFALASQRSWSESTRPSSTVLRRLGRFVFLLGLGYALHFPARKLSRLRVIDAARWQTFFVVDVLQNIAVSLITLQLLALVTRTASAFALVSALAGIAVVVLTPAVRAIDWAPRLPAPLAAYLGAGGSVFPLFGWAAYPLLGAPLAILFSGSQPFDRPIVDGSLLALLAVALPIGLVAESRVPDVRGLDVNPLFLANRLGGVLLMLRCFHAAAARIRKLPRPLLALSEESLTIYFAHLCLLYGSIWNDGLWQRIGPRLGLGGATLWVAVFVVGSTLAAWLWNAAKRRAGRGKHALRLLVFVALLYPLLG
jgi:uncharacterized membrane protein